MEPFALPLESVQQFRATAAKWLATDKVLAPNQMGHEEDTGRTKRGDGQTLWPDLPYYNPSGDGGLPTLICTDRVTPIPVAENIASRIVPYGINLTEIIAYLAFPALEGTFEIDVKLNRVSILSTPLTIDAGSKTSLDAAVPAVISTSELGRGGEITIDVTDAADGTASGLTIDLIGTRNAVIPDNIIVPPAIPAIAAGASHRWSSTSLVLDADDPVSAWADSIGGVSANGVTTGRPLYKTRVTPTGKPVVSFDGVDDKLTGDGSMSACRHFFCVAAYRPTISTDGDSLFTVGGGGYWWVMAAAMIFGYGGFGTFRRDGVDTTAVLPSGQFAVYEMLLDAPTGGVPQFGQFNDTQPGPFDICDVVAYPNELTGADLIQTRASLRQTYINNG